MGIIEAWLDDLGRVLQAEPLKVSEVRIGVFYTAALLSSGQVGVAFTPRDLSDTVCCPRSAASGPPAGQLAGQDAWALARFSLSPTPLRRALGVAVLNALSALAMTRIGVPGGQVLAGKDALEAAGVLPEDRVALVGSFLPFIKALKERVVQLCVVDKHPEALKPEERPFWRPPEQAAAVLAEASVVIATGSALVEGGMDGLLEAAKCARRVVLAAALFPARCARAGRPARPRWPQNAANRQRRRRRLFLPASRRESLYHPHFLIQHTHRRTWLARKVRLDPFP